VNYQIIASQLLFKQNKKNRATTIDSAIRKADNQSTGRTDGEWSAVLGDISHQTMEAKPMHNFLILPQ
jgi:hypothetical protein